MYVLLDLLFVLLIMAFVVHRDCLLLKADCIATSGRAYALQMEQQSVHRFSTLNNVSGRLLLVLVISYNAVLSLGSANCTNRLTFVEPNICRDGLNFSSVTEGCVDIKPADGRHKLYLVLMAPFPAADPPSWVAGHLVAPAVQLALDQINNRSDILGDYELILLKSDTACSKGYAVLKAIVDIVRVSDKPVVGIVGPGCTSAAITVARQVSRPQYSLIAITPSATSPNLEMEKYRNTSVCNYQLVYCLC